MMRFQEGDVVMVRSDIESGGIYDGCQFVHEMMKFVGQPVTISEVRDWCRRYRVLEDLDRWSWSDPMFEGYASDDKFYIASADDIF